MIDCRKCGLPLVEDVEINTLTVHGEPTLFRRSSDYVVCTGCGTSRSVRSLRAELVADGHIDADAVVSRTKRLRDAVEDALEAVREAAAAEGVTDVDVDAAFTLLSDISTRTPETATDGDE